MSSFKARNFLESLTFAINGIVFCLKTQRNIRTHFVITVLVLCLSGLLGIPPIEWAVIFVCIALVISSEIMNTIIEALIDLYYKDNYSDLARNAKDAAAGAVLICSIASMIVGMLIFIPKFYDMFAKSLL